MYRPRLSGEDREDVLIEAIGNIRICALVTPTRDFASVTHVPMVIRRSCEGQITLAGHVARANPHWRDLEKESVAIFQGPSAYMSPSWYPTKTETGKVVPTWLYVAVHAHGFVRAKHADAWKLAQVKDLTQSQEAKQTLPWTVDDAPSNYVSAMLRGIVGIEMTVNRLEGVWKLNEEEPAVDLDGTRRGLDAAGPAGATLARELDRRRGLSKSGLDV